MTTQEDHEEAHLFAFVAHNMKENGQDRSRWNRLDPRTKNRREPRSFGNPPLSFRQYRSQHTGCWVCYGNGNNHAHDHRHRRTRRPTSPPIPTGSPRSNELPIGRQRAETVEKAKERAKGTAEEKAMVVDPVN